MERQSSVQIGIIIMEDEMNLLEAKKILNIDEDFDNLTYKVYKHEVEMVKQSMMEKEDENLF